MRKIKDVLRLKFDQGLSDRQIARSCSIGRPTVAEYLRRFVAAGLTWPQAETLDDNSLDRRLFPPVPRQRAPNAACRIGRTCTRSCATAA
jgi:hypothetical protein